MVKPATTASGQPSHAKCSRSRTAYDVCIHLPSETRLQDSQEASSSKPQQRTQCSRSRTACGVCTRLLTCPRPATTRTRLITTLDTVNGQRASPTSAACKCRTAGQVTLHPRCWSYLWAYSTMLSTQEKGLQHATHTCSLLQPYIKTLKSSPAETERGKSGKCTSPELVSTPVPPFPTLHTAMAPHKRHAQEQHDRSAGGWQQPLLLLLQPQFCSLPVNQLCQAVNAALQGRCCHTHRQPTTQPP